jgi:hypothetical protein
MFLARHVNFLALGAVCFDSGSGELFREANREHKLAVAQNALAIAKRAQRVFFAHHSQAAGRKNEPCVGETVEVHRGLVNFKETKVSIVRTSGRSGRLSRGFRDSKSSSWPHLGQLALT